MSARLPSHLEVSAMIRMAEAEGGFGMVIAKGERDAGTVLLTITIRGGNARLYERMPTLEGGREWSEILAEDPESPGAYADYLARRRAQDSDIWIVELDIADAKRFAALQHKLT